jgi:uncharacterized membrane protein
MGAAVMRVPRLWLALGGGLLLVSLLANLFLGGVLAGHRWFGPGAGTGGPEAVVARFMRSVPDEARPLVRARFLERRQELVRRVMAVRDARRAVADQLGRPDLDRAELERRFETLRTRTQAAQQLVHATLAEVMRELPPEVRARWSERWQPGRGSRARVLSDRARE